MRYLPTILFLSTPLLMANTLVPWQKQAVKEREAAIHSIRTVCREVDEILLHLGVNDTPDAAAFENSSMPQGNPGETVAEADGGMLFDAANSRVTYINNVRVNDSRARLRCARRLYVQLPLSSLTDRQEGAQHALKGDNKSPKKQTASAPNKKKAPVAKTEPAKAPTSSPAPQGEATPEELPGIPVATAPATLEMPINEEPLDITTEEAVIDTKRNCILLIGSKSKSPGIHLRRGHDEMTLQPTRNGAAPTIMADDNGDVMIKSGKLHIVWLDKDGAQSELKTEAETVYYRSAEHSLLIAGKSQISTPQGTLRFDKGAVVVLEPKEAPAKTKDGFMSQFTNVSISGVAYAEAWGNVIATSPQSGTHLAGEVRGDHLVYDAKAGTCLTEGKNCLMVYGKNKLRTNGSLRLAANGDIYLRGAEITGTYERPAAEDGKAPIIGTFRTADTLVFTAENGTITAPKGITLKDAYSDFSCTGPLVLTLQQDKNAKKAPTFGKMNLAIAQYSDISHAKASGNIIMHHGENPGAPETELRASEADINLLTGETTLTAASGQQALLRSKGYKISASSAQKPALVELAANGDIHITGEQINATLQANGGDANIFARQSLHLNRESGELSIGPNSRIAAPDGIMTANGSLTATLRRTPAEQARPIIPRYPHLVYNYDGLEKASTKQGGTLQTAQASMQCKGPISVIMNPQPVANDSSPTAAIQYASAEGSVALAGKDSTGRIISATGDKLTLNGLTGEKRLSGSKVTLADAYNVHTAYGPNAGIIIDKKNNARVTGSRHTTTATRIHHQIEQQKKK